MRLSLLAAVLTSLLAAGRMPAADLIPAADPVARAGSPAREAIAVYLDGRRHAAVDMARPLAASGDADASFLMGFSLESLREPARLSRGQAMDYYYRLAEKGGHPEAALRRKLVEIASATAKERKDIVASLESASANGDAHVSRIIGEAWLRGMVDGKPDPAKALEFWKRSADAGDPQSLILLGRLREGRFGFSEFKDAAAAAGYYRRAAELGMQESFVPLASLLLNGATGTGEEAEGMAWIAKAQEAGDNSAWTVLGDHAAQRKSDLKSAMDHYRKGAEKGRSDSMLRMARLLLAEKGENGSAREGLEWLTKSADAGNPQAAAELGHRLLDSDTAKPGEALRYLELGAVEGETAAQYDLALAYLEGKRCVQDEVAAVAWLTEAMKSGDASIQYKLATLQEEGIGVPVNYANAGVLYTLAASKGHAAAAARIARMAAEGLGTAKNIVQAWAYASLAVELGDDRSKALLADLEASLSAADREAAQKALAGLRASNQKLSPKSTTTAQPSAP